MSFKPYIPTQEIWDKHFSHTRTSGSPKSFHILKSAKLPENTDNVKIISSTAQGISQAQLEIKRQYEEMIGNNPEFSINTTNKKRKVQSTPRKRSSNNK